MAIIEKRTARSKWRTSVSPEEIVKAEQNLQKIISSAAGCLAFLEEMHKKGASKEHPYWIAAENAYREHINGMIDRKMDVDSYNVRFYRLFRDPKIYKKPVIREKESFPGEYCFKNNHGSHGLSRYLEMEGDDIMDRWRNSRKLAKHRKNETAKR